MTRRYDAKSITALEFPETVRINPGMYVGEAEAAGTLQCFQEILSNATDEMTECGGGRIAVSLQGDLIIVADEGRGIPIDMHRKTKKPAVETVMTHLHAGGKIGGNKSAYGNTTIGVHGVGASAVNALSDSFDVYTYRPGGWHCIKFAKGVRVKALHKAKPTFCVNKKRGTIIAYKLDKKIMKASLNPVDVRNLCDIIRHFLPVDIEFYDKGHVHILMRKRPVDLLKRTIKNETLDELIEPVSINSNGVRFVGCWTNAADTKIYAHVAGATVPSGTHVKGLEDAACAAVKAAAPREAKDDVDVLIGFRAVLDVAVDAPSFSGQVKSSLKTASVRAQVVGAIQKELTKHLKQRKTAVRAMLEHASRVSAIDAQHKLKRDMAKSSSGTRGKLSFPKGFMAALSYPPEKRELYLCEGKSAGGSLKSAKLPWQEVLPLRGKMANVINKKGAIQSSEAVGDILTVVGYDPRKTDNKSRVGKVILLTDADDDGDHISVLLLAVFQQVMPSLLRDGKIYYVDLPLFEAQTSSGEVVTGDVRANMEKKYGKLKSVNRMKGLASCEASLLREFATDPATRRLVRIAAPRAGEAAGLIELMGADSTARKKLLSSRQEIQDDKRKSQRMRHGVEC
jgi:DNA gyrase subunit B